MRRPPDQVPRLIVYGLVILAFAWRIQGLAGESLWRDEIDALTFALGDLQRLLSMFVEPGQNGPLYFLSLRPWLQLTGHSEFSLRYPSLLLGVLSIPLTWQVSRRLLPAPAAADARPRANEHSARRRSIWPALIRDPALLAAAFLAANPYQLWYSREGKMYAATTLIVLLTTWFWLKAVNGRSGSAWWLGLVIVLVAGFYVHLLLVLLLPLLASWFLIAYRRDRAWSIGFLLILSLSLALLAYRASWLSQFLGSPGPGTGRPFIPLRPQVQATLREQLNGVIAPAHGGIWLIPMIALVAAGVLYGRRLFPVDSRQSSRTFADGPGHLLVVTWLVVPLIGIYLLSLRQPVFATRYLIWIAPAVMMALALGIQLLRPGRSRARSWLATLLVVFIIGHGLTTGRVQKQTPIKFDLRGAAGYLAQHREPGELLIFHIPHLEYAYRYYSGKEAANPFAAGDRRLGRTAGGLWTNHDLDDSDSWQQVDAEMQELTAGADDIWLMRSEVEMWDARNLMDRWLRRHGERLELVDFHGVQVVHYKLDNGERHELR